MMLTTTRDGRAVPLSAAQEADMHRDLAELGRQLAHHPHPIAVLVFGSPNGKPEFVASLRVQLGPPTMIFNSDQSAETPAQAAILATRAIRRQVEHAMAGQLGKGTNGRPGDSVPEVWQPAAAA